MNPIRKLIVLQGSHLNILSAFGAIHDLGMIHGDIRKQNILVLEDESVRLIDFENSSTASDEMIRVEQGEIACLLDELQGGCGVLRADGD